MKLSGSERISTI